MHGIKTKFKYSSTIGLNVEELKVSDFNAIGYPLQVSVCRKAAVPGSPVVRVESSHSSSSRQTTSYKCPHCDRTMPQVSAMMHHIRSHTGEKPFACPYCPYRSAQKANLKTHIRIHTGEKPFACNLCSFRAIQKIHLKKHMAKHHS